MENFDWAAQVKCSITICDINGTIIYMNDASIATFSKNGKSLIGQNLKDCHPQPAWDKIQYMMKTDSINVYSIEKNGVKKIIYQTPWKADGKVAGLVEISMAVPFQIPHYIRTPQPDK